jgi:deoxyhypusine monooxygenase
MAAAHQHAEEKADAECCEEVEHKPFKFPPMEELKAVLLDLSKPIAQRMRSIFYLRTLGGDEAVKTLCAGKCHRRYLPLMQQVHILILVSCAALKNKEGTILFRHEIAYVLGQMRAKSAVPDLVAVLSDTTDDPIVRHEVVIVLDCLCPPPLLVLHALLPFEYAGW